MKNNYMDKIDKLEKRVEALEKILNKQEDNKWADIIKELEKPIQSIKTNNQQRKEIIDEAKIFVKENTKYNAVNILGTKGISVMGIVSLIKFEVDINQKEVNCVRYYAEDIKKTKLQAKAKCLSTDVFNVHIGKAITLGRLLGLDVSKFENATQPDTVVEGMTVKSNREYPHAFSGAYYIGDLFKVINTSLRTERYECHASSSIGCDAIIIDDSNARY